MRLEVTDAWGRDIRETKVCNRCGQTIMVAIKHEGHWYGSECIKAVTGVDKKDLVLKDGEVDMKATRDRQEQKAIEFAAWQKRHNRSCQVEFINHSLRQVMGQLSKREDDFCDSIGGKLWHTLVSELSPRQQEVVMDIFCKAVHRGEVTYLIQPKRNGKPISEADYERVRISAGSYEEAEQLFRELYLDVCIED